jgi:hypothetical protein
LTVKHTSAALWGQNNELYIICGSNSGYVRPVLSQDQRTWEVSLRGQWYQVQGDLHSNNLNALPCEPVATTPACTLVADSFKVIILNDISIAGTRIMVGDNEVQSRSQIRQYFNVPAPIAIRDGQNVNAILYSAATSFILAHEFLHAADTPSVPNINSTLFF